ncbi:MAG TPA: hypothetical protein VNM40_01640 [Candidatus Paceibacterota bacterium]|nr:hypothetical protein [Candidatus Paceibacterota bacterium]
MAERFKGFDVEQAARIAAGKGRIPEAPAEERITQAQLDSRRKEAAELDDKIKALRERLEQFLGKDEAEQVRKIESLSEARRIELLDNRDFLKMIHEMCRSDKAHKNPHAALKEMRSLIREYLDVPSSTDAK